MSNWGTMVQTISEEARRSSSPSAVELAATHRAICDAIRQERYEEYRFNSDSFTFTSTAGVAAYGVDSGAGDGYPANLLRVDDDTLTTTISGTVRPVVKKPISFIRQVESSTSTQSYPVWWAWHENQMVFYPKFHVAMTVSGDYLKDIGTPTYSYDAGGATWSVLKPDGTAMDNAYTSSWFTDGFILISAQAKWFFLKRYLKDDEEAARIAPEIPLARAALKLDFENVVSHGTRRVAYGA